MGSQLLLQGMFQLVLVLRLPLCSPHHRYVHCPILAFAYRADNVIADLVKIAEMKFDFQLGMPFTPFQQLMGVLPEDSKEHVPDAYRVRRTFTCRVPGVEKGSEVSDG